MEKSINERLKDVREYLKLSQRAFSKGICMEQSSYARIEQGKTRVTDRVIELTCLNYKVNKTYLKDGKGKMLAGNPPDAKLEQLKQIFNDLNNSFQDLLINQAKEILKFQQKQDS